MAEKEPQTSTEQSSSTEPQSLDQVYQTFNVEAEAQNFQPQRTEQQPQQQPQRQEVAIPDPVLDPTGYKSWMGNQNQFVQNALSQISGQLTVLTAERAKQKEEADIKSAVSKFKSIAGEDIDEDIAEVALGQRARKDPKFLAVYQNRGKNAAAWNAAVAALANEFKSKSTFKIDPQIAENQRAAKQSIGSQSKAKDETPPNSIEARLQSKSGTEFEREWRNMIDRGY